MAILEFVLRRLLWAVLVLLGIIIVNFILGLIDSVLFGTTTTTETSFSAETDTPILSGIFWLATIIPYIAVGVRPAVPLSAVVRSARVCARSKSSHIRVRRSRCTSPTSTAETSYSRATITLPCGVAMTVSGPLWTIVAPA